MKNLEIIYKYSFSDEKKRGKTWYIIVISLIIGIVIWGILTRQYGLSIIVMIFSGVYLLLENMEETNNIVVQISKLGIFVNDTFYEYEKIPYFSIIYDEGKPVFLRLYFNSGIKFLNLNIDNSNVLEIKEILKNFIEEKQDDKLSFFDRLIKILKL